MLGATIMLWVTRRAKTSVRLALLGFILIIAFIVLRAASFNHTDELLGDVVAQLQLGFNPGDGGNHNCSTCRRNYPIGDAGSSSELRPAIIPTALALRCDSG